MASRDNKDLANDPSTSSDEDTSNNVPRNNGALLVIPALEREANCGNIIARSRSEIKQQTKNMVRTKAYRTVIEKIRRGSSWSVISGSPGEGKTTLAYFVMNYFLEQNFDVYIIKSKEEYFNIQEFGPNTAVMLNDMFGSFTFDESILNHWLIVLGDLEKLTQATRSGSKFHVVLTTRNYILKAAIPHLDKYSQLFEDGRSVTDLSSEEPLTYDDKICILRCHLRPKNINLQKTTIEKICKLSTVHGFPHCCHLFVNLTEMHDIPVRFFSCPLKFLGYATRKLMEDEQIRSLFCLLIKNDGHVKIANGSEWQIAMTCNHLDDCYLTVHKDIVVFSHPSIFWSVVFTVACRNPQFVVRECPMYVLKEIVVLGNDPSSPTDEKFSETRRKVVIDSDCEEILLMRFVEECNSLKFNSVLTHQAFSSSVFAKQFLQLMRATYPMQDLVGKRDYVSRKTFLQLAASNTSEELLKLICLLLRLNEDEQKWALFGCCESGSADSFRHLTEKHPNINFNATDDYKRGALTLAALAGNIEVVRLLLPHVDKLHTDDFGMNALHGSLEKGHTEVARHLIENGVDVNRCDKVERSPLHYASWGGYQTTVSFLLDQGADINSVDADGATALHDACHRGYEHVADTLIEAGCSVNAVDIWGDSSLHIACAHGNKRVVRCLLRSQCDIRLRNGNGRSAEDIARNNKHADILEVLQEDHQRWNQWRN